MSPAELARRLARWIEARSASRLRIGFDGDPSVGTPSLADSVADAIAAGSTRPVIRVSTGWWWRAASLRLEQGRHDVTSRLTGWVDAGALRRELLDPLAPAGSGRHLTRLRDPVRDRPVREDYQHAPTDAVLLLDGPFLTALDLPLDAVVRVGVSLGTLARRLPAERGWELAAFEEYHRTRPPATVLISFDHPHAAAVSGLPDA